MCSSKRVVAISGIVVFLVITAPRSRAGTNFSAKDYPVGSLPVVVTVADLNGDSKLDLVVLNVGVNLVGGNVSTLLGNGDGTFQAAKNFAVTAQSVAVADVNGDGKPDLILGGAPPSAQIPTCGQSAIEIMLGNGDGTFAPPQEAVTVKSIDSLATAGDLNGDGKADIIVQRVVFDSSCPAAGVSVFFGNGDGTFQPEVQAATSDLNGDGIGDLALSSLNKLTVLLGKGNGTFVPLVSGPDSQSGGSVYGDFNGDNKEDQALLALTCPGRICFPQNRRVNVGINLGNGDGSYQKTQIYQAGGKVTEIAIGDFNGDGKADVGAINFGSSLLSILLGKGDGTLPSLFTFDIGSGPDTFAVADLNGDTLPDVITANLNDNTVSVLLNTSPKSGADLSVQITAGPEPVSVTQNLTYAVQVSNSGPENASDVSLTHTLPSGVNVVSSTITQGSCVSSNLVVTCVVTKLVSGDTATETTVVIPTSAGTATTTASVTATEPDPAAGNNSTTHATHVDPMFILTVTKSGAGSGTVAGSSINCGNSCKTSLPTGTNVNLQVQPDPGSVFGGWGGACGPNNIAPGCDVAMNADQTVTATFEQGPNFFFAPTDTGLTVSPGSTVSTPLTFLPEGTSFDSAIALSCSVNGPTPAPSCTLSPPSVTPGANAVYSTLTIAAPVAVADLRSGKPFTAVPALFAFFLPALLFGIAVGSPRQCGQLRTLCLVCGCLFALCTFQSACGGAGRMVVPSHVAQSYTVTVTASSGAISKSTQIQLRVN